MYENEIWLPVNIPEFYNSHYVSNYGRVKTINGRLLSQNYDGYGYLKTCLNSNGVERTITVHKLVAITFLYDTYKENYTVNHKNAIKTDNRVENLEWCTTQENTEHAKKLGLMKSGFNHPSSKSIILLSDLGYPISQYLTIKDFEICSGISRGMLLELVNRNSINIIYTDIIHLNLYKNLELNKSKGSLSNPIKIINDQGTIIAIYSNALIMEKMSGISRKIASKLRYDIPYLYRRRNGGLKNPILYLQKMTVTEFLIMSNCIVDDYLIY